MTFYVRRGNSLVPAKKAASVMNAPSRAEKVATLGYSVSITQVHVSCPTVAIFEF